MTEKRVTKSEKYAEIKALAEDAGRPDLAEFAQAEIDALAKKAEKAREAAAKKAAEPDMLKAAVANALTGEFQTGADIFAAVDGGDEEWATLGKVRNRLTKLVNEGVAVKEAVKVENAEGKTHSVMAYRLA